MPEKSNPATSLLERAHSPTTSSTIYRERIKQKPLLLRPSSPDPRSDAREKRRRARQVKEADRRKKSRKPKPLSAKQKRALCIYDIPKEQQKYIIYEPLHELWLGYVRQILGLISAEDVNSDTQPKGRNNVTATTAGPMLVSADFHGALIEVVRSRCVSRVGLQGIVVKDTKFTFEIITQANELKSEPWCRKLWDVLLC